MGGVCTGGTLKRNSSVDYNAFSGKLKPVKSFNNQQQLKKNDNDNGDNGLSLSDCYTEEKDDDVYHRKTTSYDSGELFFSISTELKPSTPARVNKVLLCLFI